MLSILVHHCLGLCRTPQYYLCSVYVAVGEFPLIIIINDNVFDLNGNVCYMLHHELIDLQ